MAKVSYKELGLVNTREMFKKAREGGYGIPAYNFNNMEQLQAIIQGCVESRSPVILQISKGARAYANSVLLRHMARGAVDLAKSLGLAIPIALHLDHGDSVEMCKDCVDSGFSSVMIDASSKPFAENIRMTKEVVAYAHAADVTVEGELGILAGIEDHVVAEKTTYTRPEEVQEFVQKTGVDSLAIAVGTSHGAFKFKVKPGELPPPLRLDILEEVKRRLPGFAIVLHGASSVIPEYVALINQYGGQMSGAVGIPEEQIRKAVSIAVCKVNIDSDGRLAMTAKIREALWKNPKEFDPRKYLGPARDELVKLIKRKNEVVLGSAGRV